VNIYDFADRLSSDLKLRKRFLEEYTSRITDANTDSKEYVSSLYDELTREIKDCGADLLVEDVARELPGFLESVFRVDTSLVS
jgi:hypothetical protein